MFTLPVLRLLLWLTVSFPKSASAIVALITAAATYDDNENT